MVVITSGFGKVLHSKSQQLSITIWQCLSHRLELDVRHCNADTNAINHVKRSNDITQASFGES
jgi:hypothetical protein